MTTPETWQLWDYNGSSPTLVDLTDRVILPTGSHNPDTRTGEDCMTVSSMETATKIIEKTALQVLICAPPSVLLEGLDEEDENTNPANPVLLAKRVRELGRTPILFCNTTRSETAQIAIKRAYSGRDGLGGIKNIKLEVTKRLQRGKSFWLVPDDDQVIVANKQLVKEKFSTIPLIGCYTGSPGDAIDIAKRLIDDSANGIRFCAGGVGLGTGIVAPELFRRVIKGVRAYNKNIPLIAECGMNPKSIRQARELGATAALANFYVASSSDPVQAAVDCVEAAR